MSIICHHGYGYSWKLCEDVSSWFINQYFPRHKITLDIVHRSLKSDNVRGYCDVSPGERQYNPRHFLIELDTHMSEEWYIKTLFHELTHLAQWIRGDLRFRRGKLCYSQEPVENWDYEYQPHEIEAREEEVRLYDLYLFDKQGVPPGQTGHYFPNRLMAPVY